MASRESQVVSLIAASLDQSNAFARVVTGVDGDGLAAQDLPAAVVSLAGFDQYLTVEQASVRTPKVAVTLIVPALYDADARALMDTLVDQVQASGAAVLAANPWLFAGTKGMLRSMAQDSSSAGRSDRQSSTRPTVSRPGVGATLTLEFAYLT